MPFEARAHIMLPDSERVIADVCAHLAEHDAQVEDMTGAKVIRLQGAAARISSQDSATLIDVSSPTLEGLYFMRLAIASHIREFAADEPPAIEWLGDGRDLVHPPNFRVLKVVGLRDLTPHMRRITFSGDDVERFAPLDALHVNVLIPHPGAQETLWPRIGPDGLIAWGDPQSRPFRRKYTVRAVDAEAGTIAIDFLLHDEAGPGSAFASRAKVGDQIGAIGPGGGGLAEADWYLFAGDETALPAIARMLEHLPKDARGKAVLEVANASEIQPLTSEAAIEVDWLRRDASAGSAGMLTAAVKAVRFPTDGSRIYAWAGCEYDDFRAIRTYLRKERGLKKHEHLAVSYWRRGKGEDEQ